MSLEEIPDTVYVSLGRRWFDPVKPKQFRNVTPAYLKLLERIEHPRGDHREGYKTTVDYKIQCLNCTNIFYVRLSRYFKSCHRKISE